MEPRQRAVCLFHRPPIGAILRGWQFPDSPELVDLVGRAKEARDFLAELCETDDGAEEIDRAAVLLESLERALAPFEGEE